MPEDEDERNDEPHEPDCVCDECFAKIRDASRNAAREDMESDPDAPSAADLAKLFKF